MAAANEFSYLNNRSFYNKLKTELKRLENAKNGIKTDSKTEDDKENTDTVPPVTGNGNSVNNDPSTTEKETSPDNEKPSSAEEDEYTIMAKDIIDSIMSDSNSYYYDMNTDPLYRFYRNLYAENAEKSAKDVFGLATALTGGYSNSYAATAASQAAKKQYDELFSVVSSLNESAYKKHRDSISDKTDALRYIDDMKKNESDKAKLFASYGDYSLLEKMGVDVKSLNQSELFDIAKIFASYGDYSLLKALGMDASAAEEKDRYNNLLLAMKLNG